MQENKNKRRKISINRGRESNESWLKGEIWSERSCSAEKGLKI